jgi:predicted signal transduction protein with EAL and GGDEF domain
MLVTVARRIESCLSGDDVAARLGGDEFAVLLRQLPNEAAAQDAAARVADVLARPATVAGVDVDGKASIGMAIARTPSDTDSMLRRADTALYAAKTDGKGGWRKYQDGMATPGRRTTDLRHELEAAIRDQTLTLHYQPIVDLSTGRAEGFEALIRFDPIAGQPMEPEQLVAITEDNALITSLGDWALRKALTDLALINKDDPDQQRFVSVNVSARQLRQPTFAETVRTTLSATNVDASSLVLEITESVLLAHDERAWGLLAQLRRDGVRVAIDDYGTGYASLSSLRHTSIDIVKIDRSFLQGLKSRRPRIMLEAVIRLASTLGLDQVASGIEDTYTREVLRSLGCRYGQGPLFALAMPASEATRWRSVERGG